VKLTPISSTSSRAARSDRHEAGFGQIFFAVAGSGWVAGPDHRQVELAQGEAAFIRRGEVHSKGSKTGMTAFMIQVRDMTPLAR
jgi:quercetin dioxygenase-like cupin family protein